MIGSTLIVSSSDRIEGRTGSESMVGSSSSEGSGMVGSDVLFEGICFRGVDGEDVMGVAAAVSSSCCLS